MMNFMEILNHLRDAVRKDPRTQSEIAAAAKISRTTFSAFMHGRRGLSIDTIEQLAAALGLEVRLVKPAKPKQPHR